MHRAGRTSQRPRPEDIDQLLDELEAHQLELQLQNEELERSRDRYHELYELAPVGYVTLGPRTRILEANLRATELLGAPRSEVVDTPLASFLRPSEADVLQLHLRDVYQSGARRTAELVLGVDPGRGVPVRIQSVPFGDGAGCRSVLIDLSELRRA